MILGGSNHGNLSELLFPYSSARNASFTVEGKVQSHRRKSYGGWTSSSDSKSKQPRTNPNLIQNKSKRLTSQSSQIESKSNQIQTSSDHIRFKSTQYLKFVEEARKKNLELAADYLVMAAWLAFLKSKMLLPDMSNEEEPTGDEMAAALQFQLRRLQAMRDAGTNLILRQCLGKKIFKRGDGRL